jgi:hypothetical protein
MKAMKKWFPWMTLAVVLGAPTVAWAATKVGVTGCCPFC